MFGAFTLPSSPHAGRLRFSADADGAATRRNNLMFEFQTGHSWQAT